MRVQPGRLFGSIGESASSRPVATGTHPPGALAESAARVVALEPWLAPLCALALLLAPHPLIWPAAIVGITPWIARILTIGRPWRRTAFDLPLLLLAIGAAFGSWASLNREGALIQVAGLLAAFLLFAAAREHAASERVLRVLVPGLLVGAVACTLLMLVMVAPFLMLERLPPMASIVSTIDRWQLGAWVVDQDWLLQRYRFRASGVGALADVGLALAFAALIGLRGRIGRLLVGLSVLLFGVVLFVADSRGAMLAGALTLGAMATVWRRRLLPLLPIGTAVILLILAFGPTDRGLSLKTLAQRFWFWENSLYLAREVPLTGAGLGLESVQLVYRGYFQPAYPPFSHAHNVFLQGLLEYGVLGLLGLIGLGVATLWIGWRTPASPNRWTMAGRFAGFGVATAMLTSGLTEIVLLSTLGSAISLAALGLLAATAGAAPDSSRERTRQRRSAGPAASKSEVEMPRRWLRWPGIRLGIAAALLVVAVAGISLSSLGSTIGARLLLNAGTSELNRGALSESIERRDREATLERSVRLLRAASGLNETDATIQRNLALALAATDDTRRGRAAADRAKALIPPTARADLFQLGRAYVAISAWGEAVRAWHAAEAAPQLLQLGNRLIRARNFDQSINAFVAAARVEPDSAGAFDGITRASHDREADLHDTIDALDPLLEAGSPTEYRARVQAARVYRDAGYLAKASAELDHAEQISPGPQLSLERGILLLQAGRPDLAEKLLVWPVESEPHDIDGWFWLARSRAELAKHEEAVETIRQGLARVDPSGQFAPPAERLPETAAVRAAEIKRDERAPILGSLGESLIRLGRVDEAVRVLDEAVAALPHDPWLAATRDEALARRDGSPPSLLLNPTFDRTGSWGLRTGNWRARPDLSSLVNDTPPISDGEAVIYSTPPHGRSLVQEVYGLQPDHEYRLSVSLRVEGLTHGAAVVLVVGNGIAEDVGRAVGPDQAASVSTVTLDARTGTGPTSELAVVLGFTSDATPGAKLIVDDAVLVEVGSRR